MTAAREVYAAGVAATKASAGKSAAAIKAITDPSTRAEADAARIPPRNNRDSAPQNLFLGSRIHFVHKMPQNAGNFPGAQIKFLGARVASAGAVVVG